MMSAVVEMLNKVCPDQLLHRNLLICYKGDPGNPQDCPLEHHSNLGPETRFLAMTSSGRGQ